MVLDETINYSGAAVTAERRTLPTMLTFNEVKLIGGCVLVAIGCLSGGCGTSADRTAGAPQTPPAIDDAPLTLSVYDDQVFALSSAEDALILPAASEKESLDFDVAPLSRYVRTTRFEYVYDKQVLRARELGESTWTEIDLDIMIVGALADGDALFVSGGSARSTSGGKTKDVVLRIVGTSVVGEWNSSQGILDRQRPIFVNDRGEIIQVDTDGDAQVLSALGDLGIDNASPLHTVVVGSTPTEIFLSSDVDALWIWDRKGQAEATDIAGISVGNYAITDNDGWFVQHSAGNSLIYRYSDGEWSHADTGAEASSSLFVAAADGEALVIEGKENGSVVTIYGFEDNQIVKRLSNNYAEHFYGSIYGVTRSLDNWWLSPRSSREPVILQAE